MELKPIKRGATFAPAAAAALTIVAAAHELPLGGGIAAEAKSLREAPFRTAAAPRERTHGAPAPRETAPSASEHMVVIVIDDTKLVGPEDAARVAAALELIDRTLVAGGGRVGAITSGPAGLALDVTDDRSLLRDVIDAVSARKLNFSGQPDENKSATARDITIEHVVEKLARLQAARKVVVIIGRSGSVAPERQTRLKAIAINADKASAKLVWLDLQDKGCGSSAGAAADSALLAEPESCADTADDQAMRRVIQRAREYLVPRVGV